MIKELIHDIAYDKIKLSQALIRAKLIAYKIENSSFKTWLNNELNGYLDSDSLLPFYRILNCETFITYSLSDGRRHSKPVAVLSKNETEQNYFNQLEFCEPIATLEAILIDNEGILIITLTAQTAYQIAQNCIDDPHLKSIVGGHRKIGRNGVQNIIDQTKLTLIDVLLELNSEFPNLDGDFAPTPLNVEKVQNIITTNIFGNGNPVNIAAGVEAIQNDLKSVTRTD